MSRIGFLGVPEPSAETKRMFDDDIAEDGHVMNTTRLWAHRPALKAGLFDLLHEAGTAAGLSPMERAVLVAACASAFGDSYCSLAWGCALAEEADAATAAAVLGGTDDALRLRERAMAGWVRKVATGPHDTGEADVKELRDAGWSDAQIFAITVFAALRIAFSTVNSALGTLPDAAFRLNAPQAVLDSVAYGRPIEDETPKDDRPRVASGP